MMDRGEGMEEGVQERMPESKGESPFHFLAMCVLPLAVWGEIDPELKGHFFEGQFINERKSHS